MSDDQPRVLWRHEFPDGAIYELRQDRPYTNGVVWYRNVAAEWAIAPTYSVPAYLCDDLAAAKTSKSARTRFFLPEQETANA